MITKKQVLDNIDTVKKYVEEIDKDVKEKKEIKLEIKNRWTGNVIFSSTKETIKEATREALDSEADLRGADLCGANLRGADLCGANLRRADLREADLCEADLMNSKFIGKTDNPKTLTKKQLPDFLNALGFKIY